MMKNNYINEIIEIRIKILINNNLYKKKVIDEEIYSKVNEKLLKLLNNTKLKIWKGNKIWNMIKLKNQ